MTSRLLEGSHINSTGSSVGLGSAGLLTKKRQAQRASPTKSRIVSRSLMLPCPMDIGEGRLGKLSRLEPEPRAYTLLLLLRHALWWLHLRGHSRSAIFLPINQSSKTMDQ